ncbi:hypothetical protein [uncultured Stenotrophomonas sp.]|uniref:hypothetical protein n=1 Tax=uncultured Stenotrophomonas sp. TaxID=165438 RepID=UPI0025DF7E35|nr:hypothetical protein [uncultured Stenotrophomonas sp.]
MQRLWWGNLAILLPALCAAAAPDQLPMADDVQADRLLELTRSWGKPLPRAARLEDLRAMLPATPEQALTLSYPSPDRWVSYLFPGLHHACVAQVILKPADAPPP